MSMQIAPVEHPNAAMHDFQYFTDVPAQPFVADSDYEHIADTLSQIPQAFRRSLLDEYERLYSAYQQDKTLKPSACRRNANRYFLGISTYAKDQRFLNQSDENLRKKAKRYSLAAMRLIGTDANYAAACYFAENMGVSIPCKNWQTLHKQWQTTQKDIDNYQLIQSKQSDKNNDTYLALQDEIEILKQAMKQMTKQWLSIKARLGDQQWWTRQLVKLHDRQFEYAAIRFARVRQYRQSYISNASLAKVLARQQRSLKIMQNLVAVSNEGDELEMLDILKGSTANHMILRAELMNRLHGFEQYANEAAHIAEFYTITAPSKYHPSSSKYNHFTPRQTQQEYFSPLWARIRAKFKDKALSVYGFRIAEPHGDACPHWHLLLFIPTTDQIQVRNILKEYALREDPDEKGAAKNRFDYQTIDKTKGSAIGYIAKYIAKNVDGFGMQNDITDDGSDLPINESAQRVRAWASIWGIRQFQQIGGSSISIWRELRRLKDKKQANVTIEAARKAADKSDWKAYLEAQGGTAIPMRNQPIQLYHQTYCDENTGELHTNKYDEVVYRIKGIQGNGIKVETRLKQWTIQEKSSEAVAERDQLLNITATESSDAVLQRLLQSNDVPMNVENFISLTTVPFALPWSSVNNCRNAEIANVDQDQRYMETIENLPKHSSKSTEKVPVASPPTVKLP